MTEIIYVASPNFWKYLFLSLRTVYYSGTSFDRITVYCISNKDPNWKFKDPRIEVKVVPTMDASYWGTNKTYLCHSDAERVIYLDTDVMVLRPIDMLYEGIQTDLIARYGVETYMPRYNRPELWRQALQSAGAPDDFPLYSPGFMIFQNFSHKRLIKSWPEVTNKILANEIPPLPANRFAELYAFSVACSLEGLSHHAMSDFGHRYAMIGEGHEDAVVYHLGTPQFYRHYLPIEKEIGLDRRKELPVNRPGFLKWEALFRRVEHRLKSRLLGKRDESAKRY